MDNLQVAQSDLASRLEDVTNRLHFLEHEAEAWRGTGSEAWTPGGDAQERDASPPAVGPDDSLEEGLARILEASAGGPGTQRLDGAPAFGPQVRQVEAINLAAFDTPPASERDLSPTFGESGARASEVSFGAGPVRRAIDNARTAPSAQFGVSHGAANSAAPSASSGHQSVAPSVTDLPSSSPDDHEAWRRSQQASLVAYHVPPAMQRQGGAAAACCGGGAVTQDSGTGAPQLPPTCGSVGGAGQAAQPASASMRDAAGAWQPKMHCTVPREPLVAVTRHCRATVVPTARVRATTHRCRPGPLPSTSASGPYPGPGGAQANGHKHAPDIAGSGRRVAKARPRARG